MDSWLNVEIKSDWSVVIGGMRVNVYMAVCRCRNIKRTKLRGRGRVLVSRAVADAINTYIGNDGFAGLKLNEYLDRMFGDK